jgi:hypothetical protein
MHFRSLGAIKHWLNAIDFAWEAGRSLSVLQNTYWYLDLRMSLLVYLLHHAREVFDAGGVGVAH